MDVTIDGSCERHVHLPRTFWPAPPQTHPIEYVVLVLGPSLQGNVRLLDDFAEYIGHIGNAYEMHSIVQSGLIPGGKSNRRDRQSVFFTAVNPMCARQDLEGVE